MSVIAGDVYDMLCFECINMIVGDNWADVAKFNGKNGFQKIESFGYSVGYHWAERQKAQNRIWSSLKDVIKDICSNFWTELFGHNCDSLHSDDSNIFVITTKILRPLCKILPVVHGEDRLRFYSVFYKGMINGIITFAGYRVTTSFRKNRNSGDYEFIITSV